jgi:hypothetical protein
MHVRPRAPELLGDPRERYGAVDQHLGCVPRTGRRLAARPRRPDRVERVFPADPSQPPAVMRTNRALDRVPDPVVELHPSPLPGAVSSQPSLR